jgi:hypothetical protein
MVRDCGELVDGIFGKEGVILDSTADAEDAMGSLCYLGLIILGIPCEPSCLQLFFFFWGGEGVYVSFVVGCHIGVQFRVPRTFDCLVRFLS